MKVPIKQLKGAALDYAVAMVEKLNVATDGRRYFKYVEGFGQDDFLIPSYHSTMEGDRIIDREGITVIRCDDEWGSNADGYCNNKRIPVWAATIGQHNWSSSTEHQSHEPMYQIDVTDVVYGSTRREAAMRAYVAWKNGRSQFDMNVEGTVEIPDEIL